MARSVLGEAIGLAGEEHDAVVDRGDVDVLHLAVGFQGRFDAILDVRVVGGDQLLHVVGHHLQQVFHALHALHLADRLLGPGPVFAGRDLPVHRDVAVDRVDVGAADAEAIHREEGDLRLRGDPGIIDVGARRDGACDDDRADQSCGECHSLHSVDFRFLVRFFGLPLRRSSERRLPAIGSRLSTAGTPPRTGLSCNIHAARWGRAAAMRLPTPPRQRNEMESTKAGVRGAWQRSAAAGVSMTSRRSGRRRRAWSAGGSGVHAAGRHARAKSMNPRSTSVCTSSTRTGRPRRALLAAHHAPLRGRVGGCAPRSPSARRR